MFQALESGVVMGSIYALLALAINIIYSTTGIINFAHGEIVMLGAMFGLTFIVNSGIPFLPGLIMACIVIAIVAIILYYGTVRPFGDNLAHSLGWLMATLGAGIVFKNIAMLVWGTQPKSFPPIGGSELVNIFGIKILPHDIWVVAITLLIAIFFNVALGKTILGSAIKATSFSHNVTKLMGISSQKIVLTCFAMSGMIAAIGGILISPITFVGPEMTATIGLKGFGAAIIGGVGDSRGAFAGGLLLGILEALAMTKVTPGYKDAIAFLIMIIAISLKPEGIFGVAYEKKV
ncbi:branched-chain amino acid ABC transporter permease [Desulfitobacterium sp. AusDCA]|uniref:branched-chain amino acid ABC transporter permease n=1 Tax=Desulfitobacterium sp. AusDCA TaxID=3240383 RepID=UPI003DA72CF9